ncbi:porin [Singulisphaera sp. PoT]|uniref:OprO/OprP family phosphate-selective porin n=1 Tax=Singulisphaera sp. PoT TaxID=3411797 RepID=UPI003BF58346
MMLLTTLARGDEPASAPTPPPSQEERLRKLEKIIGDLSKSEAEAKAEAVRVRQESDKRYRELEQKYDAIKERLERVEAEPGSGHEPHTTSGRESPESAPPPPGATLARPEETEEPHEPQGTPLRARLEEGFALESENEEYILRMRVLDQTDFKDFIPNNQSPARSGLYIPRVRFYFEGRLTRLFEYEVSLQRSVDGQWDLLDGNVNAHISEPFQIQFGRMLTPYSYDWYDHLEQYFITPERGLFPLNFGLARQAGLLAHGFLSEKRLQYAVGGYDGHLVGLADNNNTRDVAGYFNWKPFLISEDRPGLRHLNLGASIFGGLQVAPQAPLPLRTSLQTSENDEGAQSATSTFLRFNDDVFYLGNRFGAAAHLAWYVGGLSVETEYQYGRFDLARKLVEGHSQLPVNGFHTTAGYFLTGEKVESRTAVQPLRPFDPTRNQWGPGAIELFARYSQLNLGKSVFEDGLADPLKWSANAYMTDIGFNWYLTQYIKLYIDWQHTTYGKPILLNPNSGLYGRFNDLLWIRAQLYF